MDQSHKNNDCYFFYYSTCTKGDNCAFRHEPSALGCEVMCSYWQQGNCLNEHCNFRHMELKKNRKSIPCYWETQRGGCKKPHCPFLHTLERPPVSEMTITPTKNTTTELPTKPANQEWSNRPDDNKFDGSGTESDQGRGSSEAGSFIGSPAVDPLIVNFDEESDSEGLATSPIKSQSMRIPYCKTYEEIRLEEIQAESAAYYSYDCSDYQISPNIMILDGGNDQQKTMTTTLRTISLTSPNDNQPKTSSSNLDFKILTLDEIKRRKKSQNNVTIVDDKRKETVIRKPEENKVVVDKAIREEIVLTTRKRSMEKKELEVINDGSKKSKISNFVPPVRLKRPTRLEKVELISSSSSSSSNSLDPAVISENERLKKEHEEVQIRLCDSSTSDEVSTAHDNENLERDDNKVLDSLSCDSKVEQDIEHMVDGDYFDASDDILKDIDALLVEKSG